MYKIHLPVLLHDSETVVRILLKLLVYPIFLRVVVLPVFRTGGILADVEDGVAHLRSRIGVGAHLHQDIVSPAIRTNVHPVEVEVGGVGCLEAVRERIRPIVRRNRIEFFSVRTGRGVAGIIGGLLAASQLTDASGKFFLTAMAVGYELECRMVDEIPVMIHGFDHTTLLSIHCLRRLQKSFD